MAYAIESCLDFVANFWSHFTLNEIGCLYTVHDGPVLLLKADEFG